MLNALTLAAPVIAPPISMTGIRPEAPLFSLAVVGEALTPTAVPAPDAPPDDSNDEVEVEGDPGTIVPDPALPPLAVPLVPGKPPECMGSGDVDATVVLQPDGQGPQVQPSLPDARVALSEMTEGDVTKANPTVTEVPLADVRMSDMAAPDTPLPDVAPVTAATTSSRPDMAVIDTPHEPARQQVETSVQATLDKLRPEDPEDQGRIHITLHREGEEWRVVVSADNAETLDLMRRHADQLQQDLARQGFAGAQLDFTEWSRGEEAGAEPVDRSAPCIAPIHYTHTPQAPATGLDLRL